MADHGQGRGIGGHGHLDWGERPVPFVVWGEGARPGTVSREPRSVCELAQTISSLLGVEAPAAARGRPLVPVLDPCIEPVATAGRALAVVVARDEEPAVGRVLAGLPDEACGLPVDVLLVDDGSADATPAIGREHGATVHLARGAPRARRRAAHRPRARARRGLRRGRLPRRRRRVRPGRLRARPRAGCARPGRLRARLALPRPARGDDLAPQPRQPRRRARWWARSPARSRATPSPATAPSRPGRSSVARIRARLQLRPGAHPVALGGSDRARRGARVATGGGPAAARSFATRSTWRAWRRPSGASGAPRGRPGEAPRPRSRRRARTATWSRR